MDISGVAKLIDHAVLHPTATQAELLEACAISVRYRVASLCVKPYMVPQTVSELSRHSIPVCTVIGFPHGGNTPEVKAYEASQAIEQGAQEIDMVVNIGAVVQENWNQVESDILKVREACQGDIILKVIFETDFILEDRLKIELCNICNNTGADYAKTSTGFGFVKQPSGQYAYRGATLEDVRLMRKHCDSSIGIKASGGIRTLDDVVAFVEAGASRIGTSSTETILHGLML